MDLINPYAIVLAALSALVTGFIWYNPKVFGTAWMHAAGMTKEKLKAGNMVKIFGLAVLFAFMLALAMPSIVIHQMGAHSLVQGELVHCQNMMPFWRFMGMLLEPLSMAFFMVLWQASLLPCLFWVPMPYLNIEVLSIFL